MYFMQESGEPLRLNYVKGRYGPYARNLGHVLKRVEGHFIVGFGDGSEAPGKVIELRGDAVAEADALLANHPDTRERMGRVVKLIDGFETPYGMELLASVHWVATRENDAAKTDPALAVAGVTAWTDRKRELFGDDHIRAAWQQLRDNGWF